MKNSEKYSDSNFKAKISKTENLPMIFLYDIDYSPNLFFDFFEDYLPVFRNCHYFEILDHGFKVHNT